MASNSDRRHLTTPGDGSRPGVWLPMAGSRTNVARYDSGLNQIHVIFRDGTPWVYDQVPRNIWRNFRRASSPGKYINRVLNGYPYFQGSFSYSGHLETNDGEEQGVEVEQREPPVSRVQYSNW
jgi:hypothetical protein